METDVDNQVPGSIMTGLTGTICGGPNLAGMIRNIGMVPKCRA